MIKELEDWIFDIYLSWDFYSEKEQYLEFFKVFYQFLDEFRLEVRKERITALDDLMILVFIVLETLKEKKTDSDVYEGLSKIHLGKSFTIYANEFFKIKSTKEKIFKQTGELLERIRDYFSDKVIIFPTDETSFQSQK